MKKFPFVLLSLGLLVACADGEGLPGAARNISQRSVSPGGDILPGSKGDRQTILPGTKGDRLAALEVQVHLPDIGFEVAATQKAPLLKVSVDSQAVESSFIRARQEQGEIIYYYQLKDVPLADTPHQEIVFRTAEGVVQTAGLVPALNKQQTQIAMPFDLQTLAIWLVAGEVQHQQHQTVQQLSAEQLASISKLTDIGMLTENLGSLYRTSMGRSDPTRSDLILRQAIADSQKYLNADKTASSSGSSDSDHIAALSDTINTQDSGQRDFGSVNASRFRYYRATLPATHWTWSRMDKNTSDSSSKVGQVTQPSD